jgi:cell division protein YceG involved in septum cleavage
MPLEPEPPLQPAPEPQPDPLLQPASEPQPDPLLQPASEPDPKPDPNLDPKPGPQPELSAPPTETSEEPMPLEPHPPPPPERGRIDAPRRPRAGRALPARLPARLAALIALLAAIAAVVLVLRALLATGHTKTVAAPKVVKVLIPEGRTRAQIAELAAKAGLKGSYRLASRRSPLLSPAHYGAPSSTSSLEGFLFPATYDMNPGQPVSRLVQEQLIAFRENFGASELSAARALHITPYELLTVASMIEREAQVPGDRAKIAAVIYNRLKAGIPLGIDATIYYAVEQQKGIATYTHELTEAQLHINSRYNTRTHTGLPPTPISNPGTASIGAAAHPAHAGYLYYVAGADGCGEQVFSTTLAAFEANAAAYKAAVAKNGGNPPRCKHG